MANNDFFGDYVAPGIMIAGAGVTAYRTYRDISAKGTLTAPWRAQKEASGMYKKIMEARGNRNFRTAEQVASLFYPGAGAEGVADAMGLIRGSTVKGLIRSYGLQKTAIGLGIDLENPASITREQLTSLIGGSAENPLGTRFYREHLERVASYNKLNLITPTGLQGASQRGEAALKKLATAYGQIESEGGVLKTVKQLKEEGGFALSSITGIETPVSYTKGKAQLEKAFAGREGLTSRIQQLYERVQQINSTPGLSNKQKMSMKLITLEEGGKMFHTGVRITSNKRVLNLYLEDEDHILRWGKNGKVRGVAKYVGAADIKTRILKNDYKDPFELVRRTDEYFLDWALEGGLEDFRKGSVKGGEFLKRFLARTREDYSKPVMMLTANQALNRRYANQLVLADSGLAPNEFQVLKNQLIDRGIMDPTAGLSANQATSMNVAMPTRTGHIYGADPLGLTGDNKSVAQTLRDKVVTSTGNKFRSTPALFGVRETVAGDIKTRLRTYSMPDAVANTLFSMTNRADLHLHEDEFVLADRIGYKENKSLGAFGPDSPVNAKIAKLSKAEGGVLGDLANHLREGLSGDYLQEMLDYREQLRNYLDPADTGSQAFKQFIELDEALKTITLNPGDFVGIGADGRMTTIPDNARAFYLTELKEDLVNGEPTIQLAGEMHRDLTRQDKLMAFKGIIKGETDWRYAQKLSALYEANKNDPRLIAALDPDKIDVDAIRKIFAPDLEQINKAEAAFLQSAGPEDRFHLEDAFRGTTADKRWRAAVKEVRGTQLLTVQGTKKIGDANMANLTHGLMEELFDEALTIKNSGLQKLEDNMFKLTLGEDVLQSPDARKIRDQALRRLELKHAALYERLNSIRELGYTINPETGTPQIIDNGKYNLADRFEKAVGLTMESPSRKGRWAPDRFFKDLAVAKDVAVFGIHEAAIKQGANASLLEAGYIYRQLHEAGAFKEGKARELWGATLEGQLKYGALNRTVGVHGSPAKTGGSGRQGSFNLQTLGHTQAQGGVVADMGIELAGRLTSDKADEASEIFKRSAYFDSKENLKAISINELAGSDLPGGVISDLFSPNQEQRDEAFRAVREKFGAADSGGLIFGTGSETNKYIYHPQAISTHTGGFTTPSGIYRPTAIDEALQGLIMDARMGNRDTTRRIAAYGDALAEITVGRTQAPAKAFSGHVQGSLRLQAQSNANPDLFSGLGDYINENYANKLGIRENLVDQMVEDLGIQGDRDSIIAQLRKGELASLVHRSPDTEMHRISSVQMFSIDNVLEKYATKISAGKTTPELMHALWGLSENRHDKLAVKLNELEKTLQEQNEQIRSNVKGTLVDLEGHHRAATLSGRGNKKRRANAKQALKAEVARLNATHGYNIQYTSKGGLIRKSFPQGDLIDIEARKKQLITAELADYYKKQHEGTSVWLPKQIEQVLGADYDDDQISIFMAKDKSIQGRLQERAAYQEQLLGAWQKSKQVAGKGAEDRLVESMRSTGGLSAEQKLAEEDFLYKVRQEELYKALKAKDPSVITSEMMEQNSELWKMRARAKDQMAQLEKARIGSMSNATDFARAMHRRTAGTTSAGANSRLFAEMLMGIMPESILKVRQVPMHQVADVGRHAAYMQEALRGKFGSSDHAIQQFQEHFRALHGVKPNTIIDEIASPEHIRMVLQAGEKAAASKEEFSLLTALKNETATNEARTAAMNAANNGMASSMQHELYREATKGVVPEMSPLQKNIKNTAASFSDAYDIMLRHKKPLMLGAGLAIATSMLLGSPGSISSEEADAAGARHSTGDPTTPPTDMGHSARVSTGTGRAVRVRGSSSGDIDPSVIAAKLGQRFPGSSVSFTVNDYRERINQEYIRKKLDR
jgi:hypothetical protein